MFLKIIVDNFQGIENEIQIDCKALPKKRNTNKIFITPDGLKINKIVGIIGCNSSGKTSIFEALKIIDTFISEDSNIEEKVKNFLKCKNNPEKDTRIFVELYIPEGDLPGYYSYDLAYSKDSINEKLNYKKRYCDDWNLILNIKNKNFISDINFKWKYYRNIIAHDNLIDDNEIIKLDACRTFYDFYINRCMAIDTQEENLFSEFARDTKNEGLLDLVARAGKIVDKSISNCKIENDNLYFYNIRGKRIEIDQLSAGTRKFIDFMLCLTVVMSNKGDLIVDEIENHFFSDILEYIYMAYLLDFPHQLIFTTNNKYAFDIKDRKDDRYIDNDQVYVLTKQKDNVNITKNNMRYDKVFSRAYNLSDCNDSIDSSDINKFIKYGLINNKTNFKDKF